jgi:uncharacterized protein YbaP (TraB family)
MHDIEWVCRHDKGMTQQMRMAMMTMMQKHYLEKMLQRRDWMTQKTMQRRTGEGMVQIGNWQE